MARYEEVGDGDGEDGQYDDEDDDDYDDEYDDDYDDEDDGRGNDGGDGAKRPKTDRVQQKCGKENL